jgi:hypothetical protein
MEEDNTRNIAEQIFNKPHGVANSIDLQLDDSTVDFIENEGYVPHNFIRDVLSVITLHGVEILFGHKNIILLSEDELSLLKQYTRSYGYELNVKIEDRIIMIGFEKYY